MHYARVRSYKSMVPTAHSYYITTHGVTLRKIPYYTTIHCVTLRRIHSSFLWTGTEENQKKRKCEYVNQKGCPAIVGTMTFCRTIHSHFYKKLFCRALAFNLNDCVGVNFHPVDRTNTDAKLLSCLIVEKIEED
jgi:hypothetical protein